MMVTSIIELFNALSSLGKTGKAIAEISRNKKGDSRALLEEIKTNATLCWMVLEKETAPLKAVPRFKTIEYDRLLRSSFSFNRLNRKKITGTEAIAETELGTFIGKDTASLVENIYDKIKTLKQIYEIDRENPKIRWRVRIINLQKRILLLLHHLRY